MHQQIKSKVRRLASVGILASLVSAVAPAAPLLAEECAVTDTKQDCPTSPAKPLFELFSEQAWRLPQIAAEPAPWFLLPDPPPATVAPAVVMKPTDRGVSARTSVSSWPSYNGELLARRIDAAKALAPDGLRQPKASPVSAALDVWGNLDVENMTGTGTELTRAGLGADYKLGRNATIGILAEQAEQVPEGSVATEVDRKLAAYAAVGAKTTVKVDAKAELPGESPINGAEPGAAGASVSVAPRVAHKFSLEGGKTLEPFVKYEQRMGLGAAPLQTPATGFETTETAGAGVTLAKPNSFSLTTTTDIEHLEKPEEAAVSGKLELKLPPP